MANFAERIKELRLARGMSQDALGKVVGVKKFSISGYENGKNFPEVPGLMGLADYFGVSTDYLLGRTDNPEVNR